MNKHQNQFCHKLYDENLQEICVYESSAVKKVCGRFPDNENDVEIYRFYN